MTLGIRIEIIWFIRIQIQIHIQLIRICNHGLKEHCRYLTLGPDSWFKATAKADQEVSMRLRNQIQQSL
jgi:hypothetical protein